MGALNQYFKKKWIKKLMEDYKMPQEKAKLVMDGIDKEATRDLKETISKLSKNLKPSDNNDFKASPKVFSIHCPDCKTKTVNGDGYCIMCKKYPYRKNHS